MSNPLLSDYYAFLRNDLVAFIDRSFAELNVQAYRHNCHVDVMAAKLEDVRHGRCRRLAICLPPRQLKSHCVSIAFAAWLLGHTAGIHIVCASYGQDLADTFARDCIRLMQSPFYRAVFDTKLSSSRPAVSEFTTTKGGRRLATSVGGVLTGKGGDVLIIDDPMKAEDAMSETKRAAVIEWFDGTLMSRINDKETGAVIVVMQRLHQNDLVGHLLEKGGWELLSFPAIAEEPQSFDIETPYGPRSFRREVGDLLHPERESLEVLDRVKLDIGSYAFSAQYQQSPVPRSGLMVKREWFKHYGEEERPASFDQIVASWDTANKVGELNDYSVGVVIGIKGPRYYVLHVLRRRMEFPDLKRAVREVATLHGPTVVLIEDRASGTQLIQDLKSEGLTSVHAVSPEGDKTMRFYGHTATFENGCIYLPAQAPWVDAFVNELTSFPGGKHDDQVDAMSQALTWIKQPSAAQGFLDYYRQEIGDYAAS